MTDHATKPKEIEVTPAMIEAAVDLLYDLEGVYSKESLAREVYRVMERVRRAELHSDGDPAAAAQRHAEKANWD